MKTECQSRKELETDMGNLRQVPSDTVCFTTYSFTAQLLSIYCVLGLVVGVENMAKGTLSLKSSHLVVDIDK